MADLFDGYTATAARSGTAVAFDEMFAPDSGGQSKLVTPKSG